MKKLLYIALAAVSLIACKPESVRVEIPSLADEMHIRASVKRIQLRQTASADTAVVFSWDIPALKDGITGYEYYFKMDISGNGFATSITPMSVDGGNTVAFTHKQVNEMLEKWNITAGTWAAIDAEVIAAPQGTDHYIKPMLSTVTFEAMGYASILYLAGSATSVGTDYTKAIAMTKVAGQEAYTWTGVLSEGEFLFVNQQADNSPAYGMGTDAYTLHYADSVAAAKAFTINRTGYYTLTASLSELTLVCLEPLYLFGSATPGGWALAEATPMINLTGSTLIWEGNLSAGELKFLCEPDPDARRFDGAFYMAPDENTLADGTTGMFFAADGTPDQKWQVPAAGMYQIRVDLSQRSVTFAIDADFAKLPYKQIWLCGSATPHGWDTPFGEQMTYDSKAKDGSFTWTGELIAGEIKFPLNPDSYEGAFLIAPAVDTPVSEQPSAVKYTPNDTPDQKWVVTDAGKYKITINVLDMTVKFEKQ